MEAADAIDWQRRSSRALCDENAPLYKWYSDGLVIGCHDATDRHVEAGRGERTTIIWDSPVTGAPDGFFCASTGRDPSEMASEAVKLVRERIGPVAAFRLVAVIDRLPKTRSGTILCATMARIADGEDVSPPVTIDDPAILDEIRAAALGCLGSRDGHLEGNLV